MKKFDQFCNWKCFWKELVWGFLGLRRFLNKKKELFFFDTLELKTWASVQFHLKKYANLFDFLEVANSNVRKVGWVVLTVKEYCEIFLIRGLIPNFCMYTVTLQLKMYRFELYCLLISKKMTKMYTVYLWITE